MSRNEPLVPVPEHVRRRAWIDAPTYRREYERSLRDSAGSRAARAGRLSWFRQPSKIRDVSFGPQDVQIRWFEDSSLNASVNCLDRHLPEAAVAILVCARIGAIHSVVFAGFSAESLAGRIRDCDSKLLITADEAVRGGRHIALKAAAGQALEHCLRVNTCVVLRRTGAKIDWVPRRDFRHHADGSDLGDVSTLADSAVVESLRRDTNAQPQTSH